MNERCLKHFAKIAGILVLAGMNVQAAHNSQPPDVTVYLKGDAPPAFAVDNRARAIVNWMYARIGVRLAWSNNAPVRGRVSASSVPIEISFVSEGPKNEHPGALAFARPFADGANAITVMYGQIQTIAGRATHERSLLAHVMAHEIGHVLQSVVEHSEAGVMKAQWSEEDLYAMQKKPLEFTPDDVDRIVRGLTAWKSRIAASSHGHDIGAPLEREK